MSNVQDSLIGQKTCYSVSPENEPRLKSVSGELLGVIGEVNLEVMQNGSQTAHLQLSSLGS